MEMGRYICSETGEKDDSKVSLLRVSGTSGNCGSTAPRNCDAKGTTMLDLQITDH
jgi:hypothetical protein